MLTQEAQAFARVDLQRRDVLCHAKAFSASPVQSDALSVYCMVVV